MWKKDAGYSTGIPNMYVSGPQSIEDLVVSQNTYDVQDNVSDGVCAPALKESNNIVAGSIIFNSHANC